MSPLLAYRVSGASTSGQANEPSTTNLQDPTGELVGLELGVGILDDFAVQADPALLDQPTGVRVRRSQARRRQQSREPHPPIVHGVGGDGRLRDLIWNLVLAMNAIEPFLRNSGSLRPV